MRSQTDVRKWAGTVRLLSTRIKAGRLSGAPCRSTRRVRLDVVDCRKVVFKKAIANSCRPSPYRLSRKRSGNENGRHVLDSRRKDCFVKIATLVIAG